MIVKIGEQYLWIQIHQRHGLGFCWRCPADVPSWRTLIGKGGENIRDLQDELGGMKLSVSSFAEMPDDVHVPVVDHYEKLERRARESKPWEYSTKGRKSKKRRRWNISFRQSIEYMTPLGCYARITIADFFSRHRNGARKATTVSINLAYILAR